MPERVSGAADRVRWARAAAFHPEAFRRALRALGSLPALTTASPATLRAAGLGERALARLAQAESSLATDLRWLEHPDHHLLMPGDCAFPPLLEPLCDAPLAIWVRGDPALLRQPQVAVVGSRRATATGREVAAEFAAAAVGAGWTVTSGLAIGIDAAAHRGALQAQGKTLAVCATGPDRLYPREHRELAEEIAASGALVTEFPPGTPALKAHFPFRNRLLAGLSVGTLVVEAALPSGTLVTARLAAEQGREVLVVPGSIRNPETRGCHALLKDGARLVDSAPDFLNALENSSLVLDGTVPLPTPVQAAGRTASQPDAADHWLDSDEEILLDALGFEPQDFDTLVSRTGFGPARLAALLHTLELAGWLEARAGGWFARLGNPGVAVRRTPRTPSARAVRASH